MEHDYKFELASSHLSLCGLLSIANIFESNYENSKYFGHTFFSIAVKGIENDGLHREALSYCNTIFHSKNKLIFIHDPKAGTGIKTRPLIICIKADLHGY